MTIILTGGGSGGHVTPILAVAAELRRLQPGVKLVYIGQTGDAFAKVVADSPLIDQAYSVRAGKFRRYHGEGLKQLLDLPTQFKNLRDAFYVLIGAYQSWRLIGRLRPTVVFTRGGFVSVPVAWGAYCRRVPYITHDSDRSPSLANKLIARRAAQHAVAFPKQLYPYPVHKTVVTGIPVRSEFSPVTAAAKANLRQAISMPASAKVLYIIGGGLGSARINQAMLQIAPELLNANPDLRIIHSAGQADASKVDATYQAKLSPIEQGRVQVLGFVEDIYRYSGAADLIIMRAGATNLAEFALQGKACVVIPSGFLTGGHQLQNADYLDKQSAIVVVDENELATNPGVLASTVQDLLKHPHKRQALATKLAGFAQPEAATKLANLVLQIAKNRQDVR